MLNYIKVSGQAGQEVNNLKVELYYHKGGYNYFTYKNEKRGYYLSISPVYRRESTPGITLESYCAFSGIKVLLLEVQRKSNKAEAEAEAICQAEKQKYIDYIIEKYDLTLEVA